MKTLSKRRLKQRRDKFLSMRYVDDLAELTSFVRYKLTLIAGVPQYHFFSVPKRNGGLRHIENPARKLKKVQRTLNNFLQAVYFFEKTEAAYGFIIRARDEAPRDIVSNAHQHLNVPWLMNMDLTDFFHYVKREDVFHIFCHVPFNFSEDLAEILTQLTTYKGRLPMGAPTSPVLSNFATIDMDIDLLAFAQARGWTFTRYADDMSFSMDTAPMDSEIEAIRQIAGKHQFLFNETKLKIYGPEDEKLVTGLRLGEEVTLSSAFLQEIREEIDRLQKVVEARAMAGQPPSKWVEKYTQQVQGRMAFAEKVLGEYDPIYVELEKAFNRALNPPDRFSSVNWLDFPYH
ncbi:MAG TPA: RNA-directed DNA polymerase [Saprospiraceae bacterium]|nr:RNA-directed DNA polymerase [Saprospiraceae bacterium]